MSVKIRGGTVANEVDVNTNKELLVALGKDVSTAGYAIMMTENDPGSLVGTPYLKSPETSIDYRLRVGVDTLMFGDTFNATAQNTSIWKHVFATMTCTQSGGFLKFNNAGTSTASANGAYTQSWRHIPVFGSAPLYVEFNASFDEAFPANRIMIMGLGVGTAAGTEPVDGVWFQHDNSGLRGVLVYNSTKITTNVLKDSTAFSVNTNSKYTIVIAENEIEWWLDDVLLGETPTPVAQGQPFLTTSLPIIMQMINTGVVPTSPNTIFSITDVVASTGDLATNKTWAGQLCSFGRTAQQGQNGGTMGQTVQWANATNPTSATATNTSAAAGTGLGGLFLIGAPATGTTDLVIASYQNPVGGVNQTPRTLIVRGVWVDLVNMGAAVATTPTTLALALAFGHTAVSLATAETGSFVTATTKAPRRLPVGAISLPIGAVIGAYAGRVSADFEAPLVIDPGHFIAVVGKPLVGTATASQTLMFVIGFNAYYE